MDKPTLKQIRRKYKGVKEVRCLASDKIVEIDWDNKITYSMKAYFIIGKNDYGNIVLANIVKEVTYAEIISYKEPLYKLTAKEVVHAYENPQWLKDNFKECFETELEVNRWYKYSDRIGFIVYIEKVLSNTLIKGYGISNCWNDSREWVKEGLQPATEKEVEEALVKEAIKRGIWDCPISYARDKKADTRIYLESFRDNILWSRYGRVFDNGVWATSLIPTYTIPEAEKTFNIKIIKAV